MPACCHVLGQAINIKKIDLLFSVCLQEIKDSCEAEIQLDPLEIGYQLPDIPVRKTVHTFKKASQISEDKVVAIPAREILALNYLLGLLKDKKKKVIKTEKSIKLLK